MSRLTEFSSAVAAGVTPPALAPENADIIGRLEANLLAMADSLKAQLQAARAEQAKLEAVLSGMVEGVLVIDSAGTIRLANQRAERLFQRRPGEVWSASRSSMCPAIPICTICYVRSRGDGPAGVSAVRSRWRAPRAPSTSR